MGWIDNHNIFLFNTGMNIKKMHSSIYVFCFVLLFSVHAAGEENPVIGIVLSVSGNIVQQVDNNTFELEKGSRIIRAGSLELSQTGQRGRILIGTDAGPVLYTRFPVPIGDTAKAPLSDELIANYLACTGGSVLTAKGLETMENASELFRRMIEGFFVKPPAEPLVVVPGNFLYADKGIGSAFSAYVESLLSNALVRSEYFSLFDREHLEQILEIQELNISDMFAGHDVRVGELKSIDALISGRFFDDEDEVLIFLSLLDIESGLLYGNISFPLNKRLIPPSLSILPSNAEDALDTIEDLDQVGKSEDNVLLVSAWPVRGYGGIYYDSEELVIKFKASDDCYIKIYHIDVDKKMSLIFPNKFHKNNKIDKNRVYTIPDSSYEFTFILGKPYGTEFIKIIASRSQFEDIEDAFVPLGKGSPDTISKGLSRKQREGDLTEVLFSYTILGKKD
ncbi:MAG: DUF4384 domain-containing protein [Spirochaetales bacterium]|nr:DUF4384 domain-containing protein [Spirochaetales bacterium]